MAIEGNPLDDPEVVHQVIRPIFAAVALNGLMSNPSERNDSPQWAEAYAKVAVQAADALIKELQK